MGLLTKGRALSWDESEKYIEYIKSHGIEQFCNTYHKYKDIGKPYFYFGDEIEHTVLKKENEEFKLSHNGYKVVERFEEMNKLLTGRSNIMCKLIPEYGSFMVESTPEYPYRGNSCGLLKIENNMRFRRCIIESLLEEDEYVLTCGNFPRLGAKDYCFPPAEKGGDCSESLYVSDQSINPHPRFGNLTKNIRKRRGSKVEIKVPIFQDENTNLKTNSNMIEMDAMAFGMGCGCLQLTLQAQNMECSRFLYDQLVVLSPLMLALTASTPFFKGKISDWDVRWNVISQAVDCRKPSEKGLEPLKGNEQRIYKSRYDSVSSYLHLPEDKLHEKYKNKDLVVNKEILEKLLKKGVDKQMARHIAHLFIRDPLVIYKEYIQLDDTSSTEHFDNIQSTNWQTCRLKPPTKSTEVWRVEFRPMEIQLTEFENAAFCVFMVLVSRAIVRFRPEFYLPINLVDCNMQTAHKRDAVRKEKFFFNSDLINDTCKGEEFDMFSLNEIVNGNKKFVGLIQLVRDYIKDIKVDNSTEAKIEPYLEFVGKRASGELLTSSSWQRNFVLSHPKYKKDSEISQEICSDLVSKMLNVCTGKETENSFLGENKGIDTTKLSKILRESFENKDCDRLECYLDNYSYHFSEERKCFKI